MAEFRLNRIREGSGAPPIVFVHGFLCRHQDWRHQVSYFAKSHTVVACDLRGHGETPRGDGPMTVETLGGDVAAMLREESLQGAVLVGHSMGCRIVMEALLQAAGRVAALVLVDGSRVGVDRAAGQKAFEATVEENGYANVVRGLFEDMFFDDPPDWKDETLEMVLAIPEGTGRPLFGDLVGWDAERLEDTLARLRVPVLVIQSTTMGVDRNRRGLAEGEVGPFQELILRHVPGAESVTLPGPGHFCMTEAPDPVNRRIERFIAGRLTAKSDQD